MDGVAYATVCTTFRAHVRDTQSIFDERAHSFQVRQHILKGSRGLPSILGTAIQPFVRRLAYPVLEVSGVKVRETSINTCRKSVDG